MEEAKLPIGTAYEPMEKAQQPLLEKASSKTEDNLTMEKSFSSKRSFKEVLSQPPAGVSHIQRLQWLQKHRSLGLWVQCDTCDKWRYLPHVLDKHELSTKWFCKMNPDTTIANCSSPEVDIQLHDEEDLIHSDYGAGSLVLARLPGWPWWPAIVDDCPDTEQYYWLDGFSDIPTHYNVVFFDSNEVTRAWVTPDQMRSFVKSKPYLRSLINNKIFKERLVTSIKQAEDAEKLSLAQRLEKYSFIARYKGQIKNPRKINNEVIKKHQDRLKRKYNINFSDESDSDVDGETENTENNENVIKNVHRLGSKQRITNEIFNNSCRDNVENIENDVKSKVVVNLKSTVNTVHVSDGSDDFDF